MTATDYEEIIELVLLLAIIVLCAYGLAWWWL